MYISQQQGPIHECFDPDQVIGHWLEEDEELARRKREARRQESLELAFLKASQRGRRLPVLEEVSVAQNVIDSFKALWNKLWN